MEKTIKTVAVLLMRVNDKIEHHTADEVDVLMEKLKATQAETAVDWHVFTREEVK